jgi:serine/threonine protein kinase
LIKSHKYTNKVDIWAIGCILYELIFKAKVFDDDYAALQYWSDCNKELQLPFESNTIIDDSHKAFISNLIREMLHIDPGHRPGAAQLHQKFINSGEVISMNSPFSQNPAVPAGIETKCNSIGTRPNLLVEEKTQDPSIDELMLELQDLPFEKLQNAVCSPRKDELEQASREGLDIIMEEDSLLESMLIVDLNREDKSVDGLRDDSVPSSGKIPDKLPADASTS